MLIFNKDNHHRTREMATVYKVRVLNDQPLGTVPQAEYKGPLLLTSSLHVLPSAERYTKSLEQPT